MASGRIPTLVVGGGIGGLTVALALAQQGRRVHVLEKGAEFAEIGAGLQLAPNAGRVLAKLGVVEALREHAVLPARHVWMDALAEKPITTIEFGDAFCRRYGQPYMVMHRGDLLSVLLDACRKNDLVTLEAKRDVVAVDDLGDAARARCADGASYEADVLIAADGLWSHLRKIVHDDEPVCNGYVAYRGTLPIADISPHAGPDSVLMWIGPNLHFVQYPIRRGEVFNQVAVFKSPSYRPGYDGWGGYDELEAHFSQACGYLQDCLKLMWRDKRWPMYDRKPIGNWIKNRIVLIGDAAHPMYQYIAQGACQAIEDGLCLAQHLGNRDGDPTAALLAYQAERSFRTARVQITAGAMGSFFHMDGFSATTRNAMMAARSPTDYAPLDWLYGHEV